jgi:23S rRNA (cytosine1962-C5)-methyltransferase
VSIPDPDYALLDFGAGRRLERFGPQVLDRPAPAVGAIRPADPGAWSGATVRFERVRGTTGGRWERAGTLPARAVAARTVAAATPPPAKAAAATPPPEWTPPTTWTLALEGLLLELRPTPTGQVGLFPEHLVPAREVAAIVAALAVRLGRPPEVLNLFAYTGLATLLLARAGAHVAHVDASRPAVAWARRNAALSGLEAAPIRWFVEDAMAFVPREVRRGRAYDAVILDPPTYGHAARSRTWHLDEGLGALLAGCAALTGPQPGLVLLTAHTTGLGAADLRGAIAGAWGAEVAATAAVERLGVARPDGAVLPGGISVIVGG